MSTREVMQMRINAMSEERVRTLLLDFVLRIFGDFPEAEESAPLASTDLELTPQERMEAIRSLRGAIKDPNVTLASIREERLAKYREGLD